MKKYLMTVMAAVALGGLFTGCNKDVDLSGNTAELDVVKNYEDAFVTRFGQPHENQTWGFGEAAAETRALTRGVNANGNMWASEEGGNWKVPTQLTEEQKDIVRQYFQQNKPIGYEDPKWEDYFIQQVYKGGTKCKDNGGNSDNNSLTTEKYHAANGNMVVGSDHMDHLCAYTVDGTVKDHIYNFNDGTCSTYGNILNSEGVLYYDVNGNCHPDKIQLMVGSTTANFGYYNSEGSLSHIEYTGLVHWTTIRDWANRVLGQGKGDCLDDKWNRSYMGFDYEQIVGEGIYAKDNSGNKIYAKLSDFENLNNIQYVWYQGKLQKIGPATPTTPANNAGSGGELDIKKYFKNCYSGSISTDVDDGNLVFSANGYGGLQAYSFENDNNWSSYTKLVIKFAAPTPEKSQITINTNSGSVSDFIPKGVTDYELDLSDKNISTVNSGVIQDQGAGGDYKISRMYLVGGESSSSTTPTTQEYYYDTEDVFDGIDVPYLITNSNQYCGQSWKANSNTDLYHYYSYVDNNGATHDDGIALDLDKLKAKYDEGYLPVSGSAMKEWIKFEGASDGYHSDWIVTLTKAEKNTTTPPPSTSDDIVCRIIVEDLTVGESSDFDFNDVVFDVRKDGTLIIRAIGGELPIYIGAENANEVHAACSITLSGNTNQGKNSHRFMRNTGWQSDANSKVYEGIDYHADLGHIDLKRTFNTPADALEIGIWVHKNGENIKLKAPRGKVASMVCVGTDYKWCAERQDIDDKYHKGGVRLFREYVIGNPDYQGDWKDKNAWYHKMNQ
jgi:hypothetical protein